MANIKIDTRQMQEASNDIIKLSLELNEAINMLFSRISNVASENGGWSGNGANEFVRRALIEKTHYIALKNEFIKCGKFLSEAAYRYEDSARKNRM